MKIFTEINSAIDSYVDNNEDAYLGHFPFKEFDAEDKKELESWTPLGSTLYEKTIGAKTFTLDIVFPEE